MKSLPKCKLCGCEPEVSKGKGFVRCSCPACILCFIDFTRKQWTAINKVVTLDELEKKSWMPMKHSPESGGWYLVKHENCCAPMPLFYTGFEWLKCNANGCNDDECKMLYWRELPVCPK